MIKLALNALTKSRSALAPYVQNGYVVFFVAASAQIVDYLNVSSFLTAMDDVQTRFDSTYSLASWTVSAYSVTFAGFLPFFGKLSDILGHHIILTGGYFGLAVFAIIAALVPNVYAFIVLRALQGICAAATIPPGFALIAHSFEGRALALALSIFSLVLTCALGGGFIIGGAFSLTGIGYRSICWLTAAYALFAGILGLLSLKPVNHYNPSALKKLDFFGMFLVVVGGILLVLGFTEVGDSWKKPTAYAPITVGILLLVVFAIFEAFFFRNGRGASIDMMIPPAMLHIKNFKVFPITLFSLYAGFLGFFATSIQYFLYVNEDSPLISGVKSVPFLITQTVIVSCFIWLTPYGTFSPKWTCSIAMFLAVIASIVSIKIELVADAYWKYFVPCFILTGAADSLFGSNYFNMIIFATPLEMQGLVIAMCITASQYGVAVGLSIITSIIGNNNTEITDKSELSDIYRKTMYMPLAFHILAAASLILLVRDLSPEDIKQVQPQAPVDGEGAEINSNSEVQGESGSEPS